MRRHAIDFFIRSFRVLSNDICVVVQSNVKLNKKSLFFFVSQQTVLFIYPMNVIDCLFVEMLSITCQYTICAMLFFPP